MSKLLSYVKQGGCACKLGPHILEQMLVSLQFPTHPNVMANASGMEDAGIYRIHDELALVQTVDFFMPLVDDPYTFGRIAACNSVSDVFAMGATPISALNLVGCPVPLVKDGTLTEILVGAHGVMQELSVAVLGGHSIETEAPIFGMAVTGTVNPQRIWFNHSARAGDVIVITKAIGTGILSTAAKGNLFPNGVNAAMESMSRTNQLACRIASSYDIHAATDVTGFSLVGHMREMAMSSSVSIELLVEDIPLLPDVKEAAAMGLVPAATYGNRKALQNVVLSKDVSEVWNDIVFDPQTSGGLLFSLSEADGIRLVREMHEAGIEAASIIGCVKELERNPVYVR